MGKKYRIGITLGDINGIGPEVVLKTMSESRIFNFCIPVIYGSGKVLGYHKNILNDSSLSFVTVSSPKQAIEGKINVINAYHETVNINLGKVTAEAGKFAYVCLDTAVTDLHNGLIDGLVTGPINKEAMAMADFPEKGHTEYIAKKVGDEEPLMFMISEELKVAVATTHVPLGEVTSILSKELIEEKILAMKTSLIQDFGKEKPLIAVMGLNPHAGDNGTIGSEEEDYIKNLIVDLKDKGIMVTGPHSADGFFGSGEHSKYDGILAMYHDQGLIPFKALCFGNGVNFTAGLHVIRTSPDHGTGFDIAGKNKADASSFKTALFSVIDIIRNRNSYTEQKENALIRT
ncbi:MAG: 4-hydroxythreonine-4-phosphate dehydrogenase PdxA [Saprospiraceae bacterium]